VKEDVYGSAEQTWTKVGEIIRKAAQDGQYKTLLGAHSHCGRGTKIINTNRRRRRIGSTREAQGPGHGPHMGYAAC